MGWGRCDCGWTNAGDEDAVVVAEVKSSDNNFNSFHCFIDGANVCAWGSNRNNKVCRCIHRCQQAYVRLVCARPTRRISDKFCAYVRPAIRFVRCIGLTQDDGGGCWFVVPAGSSYNCSMEWGATDVLHSSATTMQRSLFGASTLSGGASGPMKPARGVDRAVVCFQSWSFVASHQCHAESPLTVPHALCVALLGCKCRVHPPAPAERTAEVYRIVAVQHVETASRHRVPISPGRIATTGQLRRVLRSFLWSVHPSSLRPAPQNVVIFRSFVGGTDRWLFHNASFCPASQIRTLPQ